MSLEELAARAAVAAVAAFALIAVARRTRLAAWLSDRPNERSLHGEPTPRIGGLGVVAASGLALAGLPGGPVATLLVCALALAALSLADDARALPVILRLVAHLAAAVVATLAAWPGAPLWAAAILVLAIAWMTNLYNFMDGSDGLAGGMAAVGFGTYAIAAWSFGAEELALASAVLAAASLGFLAHNTPPARVFLGDAGSVPLGFLAAALGALGAVTGSWPAWFPALVFSPFIVDATLTLLRRIAAGEPVWRAHRSHYYQRLVLAGWSKPRLAGSGLALAILVAASALFARRQGFMLQCGIILGWAAVYTLLLVAIDRRAPRLGRSGDPGPR